MEDISVSGKRRVKKMIERKITCRKREDIRGREVGKDRNKRRK